MFKTIEECGLEVISFTGDDWMPVRAARASFNKHNKTGKNVESDRKLMRYLAEHKHTSCFEHQSATFLIEVPLFIRSQIHRHRTFAYNEISRRYTEENLGFWKPTAWRKQATSNKQASDATEAVSHLHVVGLSPGPDTMYFGSVFSDGSQRERSSWHHAHGPPVYYREAALGSLYFYEALVRDGVAREQARAVLPQSLLTQFYMTGNLRNWAHFIKLRTDEHAQQEVQVVANRISDKLLELYPESWKALMENL